VHGPDRRRERDLYQIDPGLHADRQDQPPDVGQPGHIPDEQVRQRDHHGHRQHRQHREPRRHPYRLPPQPGPVPRAGQPGRAGNQQPHHRGHEVLHRLQQRGLPGPQVGELIRGELPGDHEPHRLDLQLPDHPGRGEPAGQLARLGQPPPRVAAPGSYASEQQEHARPDDRPEPPAHRQQARSHAQREPAGHQQRDLYRDPYEVDPQRADRVAVGQVHVPPGVVHEDGRQERRQPDQVLQVGLWRRVPPERPHGQQDQRRHAAHGERGGQGVAHHPVPLRAVQPGHLREQDVADELAVEPEDEVPQADGEKQPAGAAFRVDDQRGQQRRARVGGRDDQLVGEAGGDPAGAPHGHRVSPRRERGWPARPPPPMRAGRAR